MLAEKQIKPVPVTALYQMRSWSPTALHKIIRRAEQNDLIETVSGDQIRLTPLGLTEAARVVHEHRLWELYLITYADVASSKVDRDADAIEHVLEPEVIAELEALLIQQASSDILASPHTLEIDPGNTDSSVSQSGRPGS